MDIPLPGETIPLPPSQQGVPPRPSFNPMIPPPLWAPMPPPVPAPTYDHIPLPSRDLMGNLILPPGPPPVPPPGISSFHTDDMGKYSPSKVTPEDDLPVKLAAESSEALAPAQKVSVLNRSQAKKRLMAFSMAKQASTAVQLKAAALKVEEKDDKKDNKKKKKNKKEERFIDSIKREGEKLKEAMDLKRPPLGRMNYSHNTFVSLSDIPLDHSSSHHRSDSKADVKEEEKSSETRPSTEPSKTEDGVSIKEEDDKDKTSESTKEEKVDEKKSSSKSSEKSKKSPSVEKESSRTRNSDKSRKEKDSERRDEGRRRRKSSKDDRHRPPELPNNWKEFKHGKFNIDEFRRIKIRERSSSRSRDRRRRSRDRRSGSRDRKHRSHHKSPEAKSRRSSRSASKEKEPTGLKLFHPFVAKGAKSGDKEYPSSFVRHTKTRPKVAYCENPLAVSGYYKTRRELFETESKEIVELMLRLIENRREESTLNTNGNVQTSGLVALLESYEGDEDGSEFDPTDEQHRERAWFLDHPDKLLSLDVPRPSAFKSVFMEDKHVPEREKAKNEKKTKERRSSESKKSISESVISSTSSGNKICVSPKQIDEEYSTSETEAKNTPEVTSKFSIGVVKSKWDSDYEGEDETVGETAGDSYSERPVDNYSGVPQDSYEEPGDSYRESLEVDYGETAGVEYNETVSENYGETAGDNYAEAVEASYSEIAMEINVQEPSDAKDAYDLEVEGVVDEVMSDGNLSLEPNLSETFSEAEPQTAAVEMQEEVLAEPCVVQEAAPKQNLVTEYEEFMKAVCFDEDLYDLSQRESRRESQESQENRWKAEGYFSRQESIEPGNNSVEAESGRQLRKTKLVKEKYDELEIEELQTTADEPQAWTDADDNVREATETVGNFIEPEDKRQSRKRKHEKRDRSVSSSSSESSECADFPEVENKKMKIRGGDKQPEKNKKKKKIRRREKSESSESSDDNRKALKKKKKLKKKKRKKRKEQEVEADTSEDEEEEYETKKSKKKMSKKKKKKAKKQEEIVLTERSKSIGSDFEETERMKQKSKKKDKKDKDSSNSSDKSYESSSSSSEEEKLKKRKRKKKRKKKRASKVSTSESDGESSEKEVKSKKKSKRKSAKAGKSTEENNPKSDDEIRKKPKKSRKSKHRKLSVSSESISGSESEVDNLSKLSKYQQDDTASKMKTDKSLVQNSREDSLQPKPVPGNITRKSRSSSSVVEAEPLSKKKEKRQVVTDDKYVKKEVWVGEKRMKEDKKSKKSELLSPSIHKQKHEKPSKSRNDEELFKDKKDFKDSKKGRSRILDEAVRLNLQENSEVGVFCDEIEGTDEILKENKHNKLDSDGSHSDGENDKKRRKRRKKKSSRSSPSDEKKSTKKRRKRSPSTSDYSPAPSARKASSTNFTDKDSSHTEKEPSKVPSKGDDQISTSGQKTSGGTKHCQSLVPISYDSDASKGLEAFDCDERSRDDEIRNKNEQTPVKEVFKSNVGSCDRLTFTGAFKESTVNEVESFQNHLEFDIIDEYKEEDVSNISEVYKDESKHSDVSPKFTVIDECKGGDSESNLSGVFKVDSCNINDTHKDDDAYSISDACKDEDVYSISDVCKEDDKYSVSDIGTDDDKYSISDLMKDNGECSDSENKAPTSDNSQSKSCASANVKINDKSCVVFEAFSELSVDKNSESKTDEVEIKCIEPSVEKQVFLVSGKSNDKCEAASGDKEFTVSKNMEEIKVATESETLTNSLSVLGNTCNDKSVSVDDGKNEDKIDTDSKSTDIGGSDKGVYSPGEVTDTCKSTVAVDVNESETVCSTSKTCDGDEVYSPTWDSPLSDINNDEDGELNNNYESLDESEQDLSLTRNSDSCMSNISKPDTFLEFDMSEIPLPPTKPVSVLDINLVSSTESSVKNKNTDGVHVADKFSTPTKVVVPQDKPNNESTSQKLPSSVSIHFSPGNSKMPSPFSNTSNTPLKVTPKTIGLKLAPRSKLQKVLLPGIFSEPQDDDEEDEVSDIKPLTSQIVTDTKASKESDNEVKVENAVTDPILSEGDVQKNVVSSGSHDDQSTPEIMTGSSIQVVMCGGKKDERSGSWRRDIAYATRWDCRLRNEVLKDIPRAELAMMGESEISKGASEVKDDSIATAENDSSVPKEGHDISPERREVRLRASSEGEKRNSSPPQREDRRRRSQGTPTFDDRSPKHHQSGSRSPSPRRKDNYSSVKRRGSPSPRRRENYRFSPNRREKRISPVRARDRHVSPKVARDRRPSPRRRDRRSPEFRFRDGRKRSPVRRSPVRRNRYNKSPSPSRRRKRISPLRGRPIRGSPIRGPSVENKQYRRSTSRERSPYPPMQREKRDRQSRSLDNSSRRSFSKDKSPSPHRHTSPAREARRNSPGGRLRPSPERLRDRHGRSPPSKHDLPSSPARSHEKKRSTSPPGRGRKRWSVSPLPRRERSPEWRNTDHKSDWSDTYQEGAPPQTISGKAPGTQDWSRPCLRNRSPSPYEDVHRWDDRKRPHYSPTRHSVSRSQSRSPLRSPSPRSRNLPREWTHGGPKSRSRSKSPPPLTRRRRSGSYSPGEHRREGSPKTSYRRHDEKWSHSPPGTRFSKSPGEYGARSKVPASFDDRLKYDREESGPDAIADPIPLPGSSSIRERSKSNAVEWDHSKSHDTDYITDVKIEPSSPVASPLVGLKRSVADSTISDSELVGQSSVNNKVEDPPPKTRPRRLSRQRQYPHVNCPVEDQIGQIIEDYQQPSEDNENDAYSPGDSPKRISLDDRIELELGIKVKKNALQQQMLPYQYDSYNQQQQLSVYAAYYEQYMKGNVPASSLQQFEGSLNYGNLASVPVNYQNYPPPPIIPTSNNMAQPPPVVEQKCSQPNATDWNSAEAFIGAQPVMLNTTGGTKVVQVGNVLQVVPTDTPAVPKPQQEDLNVPTKVLPSHAAVPSKPMAISQVVQKGNVLHVVPQALPVQPVPSPVTPPKPIVAATSPVILPVPAAALASPIPSPQIANVIATLPALQPSPISVPSVILKEEPVLENTVVLDVDITSKLEETSTKPKKPLPLPPAPLDPAAIEEKLALERRLDRHRRKEKHREERRKKRMIEKERIREQRAKELAEREMNDALTDDDFKEDVGETSFISQLQVDDDMDPEEVKLIQEAISEVPGEESPTPISQLKALKLKKKKKKKKTVEVVVLPPAGRSILVSPGFGGMLQSTILGTTRKSVKFADGVRPGEGTSPSGGEEMPSSPPPKPKLPKEKRYRKKKKVKVKIIRQYHMEPEEDDDDDDDLSPPPPPPGSPPPPPPARPYPGTLIPHYVYPQTPGAVPAYVYSQGQFQVIPTQVPSPTAFQGQPPVTVQAQAFAGTSYTPFTAPGLTFSGAYPTSQHLDPSIGYSTVSPTGASTQVLVNSSPSTLAYISATSGAPGTVPGIQPLVTAAVPPVVNPIQTTPPIGMPPPMVSVPPSVVTEQLNMARSNINTNK